MPALLLERLPLPSLQTYVTISVVFLASALLYTHHTVITAQSAVAMDESRTTTAPLEEQVSKQKSYLMSDPDPDPKVQAEEGLLEEQVSDLKTYSKSEPVPDPEPQTEEGLLEAEMLEMLGEMESGNVTLPYDSYKLNFLWVLTSEAWCVWVSISLHCDIISLYLFFLCSSYFRLL